MSSARSSRAVPRLLRALATPEEWLPEAAAAVVRRAAPPPPGELAAAARWHRVAPQTAAALDRVLPDAPDWPSPADRAALRAERELARARHARVVATLHAVGDALDRSGLAWAAVKGPVLAGWYPRADLRAYEDLDVLVPRRALGAALDALTAAGFRLAAEPWGELVARDVGQVHLAAPTGAVVDLHVDLVHDGATRARFAVPPAEELVAAAVPRPVGGRPVPTLDPVASMLHVCLHAALAGGRRLGWLLDAGWSLAALDPEGRRELPDEARSWRVAVPVHLVLAAARRTLAAPVPVDLLAACTPAPGWSAVLHLLAQVDPPEAAPRRRSPAALLARSSAGGLPRTAAQVLRAVDVRRRRPLPAPSAATGPAEALAWLARAGGPVSPGRPRAVPPPPARRGS